MRKFLVPFLVAIIVAVAFYLRFYKVTQDPPSLNWDEVSIGYNAYSILKTGKDEWGVKFPFHFKSYGEYKLPVQIYATVPTVAVFGLNELGVRILPVIYGALTVLVLYFLALELTKNRFIGLASAFLLAISPWHIHLTRASLESSFSVFWVTLGALFFFKGLKKPIFWVVSVVSFIISIYTYNAARVFTPLLIVALFFLYRKEVFKNVKVFVLCISIFVVSMIPLYRFYISGEATARLKLVSILDDPGFVERVNEARNFSNLPGIFPRLIHNKVTHFTYVFVGNYLSHFSPDFLFINGAGHRQHSVQGMGEFFWWQAIFIVLGFYFLIKRKLNHRWFLFSWLFLAFIPVSITVDSIPNALRTILAVIPYEIICALGMYYFYVYLKGKDKILKSVIAFVFALVVASTFQKYLTNYYSLYPVRYSRDWQYGNKQAVNYIKDHYEQYDMIVFSRTYGEPHMFTLFYLNWDPAKFQTDPNLDRFETFDWVRVLKFDKFYFPDLGDSGTTFEEIKKENPDKKILFIGKNEDFPENYPRLTSINFLNGDPAFDIVESGQ